MKIDTKYYGEIDYTKDELVVFPDGLFGFSQYHDYLPLSMEEDDSSLLILQSVDEPYVAFFLSSMQQHSFLLIHRFFYQKNYPFWK